MKYKQFYLILILLAFSFTGCEKNKNPTVTLLNGNFMTSNTTISAGGLLKFKWEAKKGKADLSSFTVQMNGNDLPGFPETTLPADVFIDSTYREGPVQTGNYTFSFSVTDADGNIGDRANCYHRRIKTLFLSISSLSPLIQSLVIFDRNDHQMAKIGTAGNAGDRIRSDCLVQVRTAKLRGHHNQPGE